MLTYLIGVATGLTVATILGVAARVRRAHADVGRHDRLVANLDEDLRRWVRDRDRQLEGELALVAAYARNPDLEGDFADRLVPLRAPVPDELRKLPPGSQYESGAHLQWRAETQRRALHEYRDEATRKLREADELAEAEGRLHRFVRRRRGVASAPCLALTDDCAAILVRWRTEATIPGAASPHTPLPIDDPTRPELEPRLAQLEQRPRPLKAGGSP